MPPRPRTRRKAIRTTPSSTSMSPTSRCRPSAAVCSATTATTGWPARLKPGQQALVVAGSGRYSFKGAAYVRGGIFDRIELIQDTNSIRFRDRDHTRLGSLAAEGAPDFPEIALFVVPPEFAFDPTEPWVLQLLVQRVVGTTGQGLAHLRSRLHASRRLHQARGAGPAGRRQPRRRATPGARRPHRAKRGILRRPTRNRCG